MDDKVPLSEFVGRVRVRGANSLGTPPGEGDGLQAAAQAHRHVGLQIRGVGVQASAGLVAGDDAVLSSDIVRLVAQWLGDAGLTLTQRSLLDEAAVGRAARAEAANDVVRLKRSISDGDWADVDRLLATPLVRNQRSLVYAAYRQQFLECIDHHDVQKAFTFLNKRLKPLESLQTTPAEFRDLCYLLTAKSVHDAPSFRNWEGVAGGREKLVDQLQSMVDFEYSADNDHEGMHFLLSLCLGGVSILYCILYVADVCPTVFAIVNVAYGLYVTQVLMSDVCDCALAFWGQ